MDYRSTPAMASRRWPRRSRRHRLGARPEQLRTAGRVIARARGLHLREREILVRGDSLRGLRRGEELDRPLDEEGWFHTRDLGELDESGYLRIGGRLDNLFISGGENVQPEEIEEALCRLNGVEEAVVVPVSDEEWGKARSLRKDK